MVSIASRPLYTVSSINQCFFATIHADLFTENQLEIWFSESQNANGVNTLLQFELRPDS